MTRNSYCNPQSEVQTGEVETWSCAYIIVTHGASQRNRGILSRMTARGQIPKERRRERRVPPMKLLESRRTRSEALRNVVATSSCDATCLQLVQIVQ